MKSAVVAFVMKVFVPLIHHSFPYFVAVVSMRVMSLPCSGSVKAAEAIATLLEIEYGGYQSHMKGFREAADIIGRLAICKLIKIEQVE